jgi:EAL domain-containing protein (putative c-di-GMP-specific phosphodiesterase class I)
VDGGKAAVKREDDLVAYARRLVRAVQPHLAIAIDLAALFRPHEDPRRLRLHQGVVIDMAARVGAEAFLMRTGDMALVLPPGSARAGDALVEDMIDVFAKDADLPEATLRKRVTVYPLPEQIWEFRSWIARYTAGGALAQGPSPDSDDGLRGRMNAEMLSRIEQRILRCDIRDFIRQQPICRRPSTGSRDKWTPVIQERFLGMEALRSRLFPKVELIKNGPLFQELCLILDERLIHHLVANRIDTEVRTSMNISVEGALAPMIDLLAKRVGQIAPGHMAFEIPCIDLLNDVARGRRAIARLRDHGFSVLLDGLNFDLLPYLRLDKVDCDFFKVQFNRDNVQLLANEAAIKAIRDLPPERIVFSRCDHEGALDVGAMLGVGLYQGWMIDRLRAF